MVQTNQRPRVLEKPAKTCNYRFDNNLQAIKNYANAVLNAFVQWLNPTPTPPDVILSRLNTAATLAGMVLPALVGFYRVKSVTDMVSAPPAGMYTDNGGLIWP